MLLQVVKDCLNLGSSFEQLPLAFGQQLLALFVVRRCQDKRAERMPHLSVEWYAAVARIADRNLRVHIDQLWYDPAVVDGGSRKDVGTESPVIVDAGVQLKTVVLSLPVVAGMGVASGGSFV